MDQTLKTITFKKLKLDQLPPLSAETEKQLEDWLRVELTYSSNAIEGNTLTRIETAEIIEKGVAATVSAKSIKDQLEAINHAKAIDFIKNLARGKKTQQAIPEADILTIHKLILTGINDEWAGRYRQTEVFVRGASVRFPLPQNVPYAMNEFMQWLAQPNPQHPVQIAAEAHLRLVTVHPFVDGNGRAARLLMNLILFIYGYPIAVIRNEERTEYLEAVNRGQTRHDPSRLYSLVEHSVERSLDAYLNAAKGKPALSSLTEKPAAREIQPLKIGQLARATGESVATIRYWTLEGLLKVAGFSPGMYQHYHPSQVERVNQIRYLQNSKRLTLREIRDVLDKAA